MTITRQEFTERLEEIREEFCPSSLEDLQAAIDAGHNELCGCSICVLCRDLLIAELNEMSLADQGDGCLNGLPVYNFHCATALPTAN